MPSVLERVIKYVIEVSCDNDGNYEELIRLETEHLTHGYHYSALIGPADAFFATLTASTASVVIDMSIALPRDVWANMRTIILTSKSFSLGFETNEEIPTASPEPKTISVVRIRLQRLEELA